MLKINYGAIYYVSIKNGFVDLVDYQSTIEEFLNKESRIKQKETDKFWNSIKTKESGISDEGWDYLDNVTDLYKNFEILYKENFRRFFITQLVAYIEVALKDWCYHHWDWHLPKDHSEASPFDSFQDAKEYLKRIGISVGNLKSWNFIHKCFELRHCIVHNDGRVIKGKKRDNKLSTLEPKFLSRIANLAKFNDEVEYRVVNAKLANELIKQGNAFFKELSEQLKYETIG